MLDYGVLPKLRNTVDSIFEVHEPLILSLVQLGTAVPSENTPTWSKLVFVLSFVANSRTPLPSSRRAYVTAQTTYLCHETQALSALIAIKVVLNTESA